MSGTVTTSYTLLTGSGLSVFLLDSFSLGILIDSLGSMSVYLVSEGTFFFTSLTSIIVSGDSLDLY